MDSLGIHSPHKLQEGEPGTPQQMRAPSSDDEIFLACKVMRRMMRYIRHRINEPYHILREDHRKQMETLISTMTADIRTLEDQVRARTDRYARTWRSLPSLVLNDSSEPNPLSLISQVQHWKNVLKESMPLNLRGEETVWRLSRFFYCKVFKCLMEKPREKNGPKHPALVLQPSLSRLGVSFTRLLSACDRHNLIVAEIQDDLKRAILIIEHTPFHFQAMIHDAIVARESARRKGLLREISPASLPINLSNKEQTFSDHQRQHKECIRLRKPPREADSSSVLNYTPKVAEDDFPNSFQHRPKKRCRTSTSTSRLSQLMPTIEEVWEHANSTGDPFGQEYDLGDAREVQLETLPVECQNTQIPKHARNDPIERQLVELEVTDQYQDVNDRLDQPLEQLLEPELSDGSSKQNRIAPVTTSCSAKPKRAQALSRRVAVFYPLPTTEYVYQLIPTTPTRTVSTTTSEESPSPPKSSTFAKLRKFWKNLSPDRKPDGCPDTGSKSSQRPLERSFPIPDHYSFERRDFQTGAPQAINSSDCIRSRVSAERSVVSHQQPRAIILPTSNSTAVRYIMTPVAQAQPIYGEVNQPTTRLLEPLSSTSFSINGFTRSGPTVRSMSDPWSAGTRYITSVTGRAPTLVYAKRLQDSPSMVDRSLPNTYARSFNQVRQGVAVGEDSRSITKPNEDGCFYRFPSYPRRFYDLTADTQTSSTPQARTQPNLAHEGPLHSSPSRHFRHAESTVDHDGFHRDYKASTPAFENSQGDHCVGSFAVTPEGASPPTTRSNTSSRTFFQAQAMRTAQNTDLGDFASKLFHRKDAQFPTMQPQEQQSPQGDENNEMRDSLLLGTSRSVGRAEPRPQSSTTIKQSNNWSW